jgi:superkiller protein 3
VLARQGRHGEAIACYEQATALEPGVARFWNNLGAAQLDAKRPDDAVRSIRTALRLDPQDAVAWNNLGAALAELRRFDDAIDALRKAVELAPSYANARHRLGKTLADAGRHAEAVRSLDEGIAAIGMPAGVGMANELARLLAACPDASFRNAARAFELAEQVDRATGGTSWEAQDTLAIARAANGRFDGAIESAARALELARAAGAASSIPEIEQRLASFRRGEPYVGR